MRENLVEIRGPIWNGGKPQIGIADFRIKSIDKVRVKITYKRKDGTESYPDIYTMLVSKLLTYPVQIVGGGVKLYVAPLSDWDIEPKIAVQEWVTEPNIVYDVEKVPEQPQMFDIEPETTKQEWTK